MRAIKEENFKSNYDVALSVHDYQINIERAMRGLSDLEQRAISLRFFQPLTIAQVADCLGMSWEGADELIDRATEKARAFLQGLPCAITTNQTMSEICHV